ncbi:MAG: winged helix-turn-helix transcriptional regulator [Parcubacteria group bacterium]|nr:winged helix-turn-helix transcriptional regulator [Parcubacteria group bacterium]
MSETHKQCAGCFRALADPTRIRILKEIRQQSQNVGALRARFDLTQPTISHHLQRLHVLGLVKRRQRGREALYSFNEDYPCRRCGVFTAPIHV